MRLTWHPYRYFPYEKELAAREVTAVLNPGPLRIVDDGLELANAVDEEPARRLTYFSAYVNGHGIVETIQSRLESGARFGKSRQSTRYSVHGLHEYKGKFNPQIARALLNIFDVQPRQRVLDPFCGSGTTLVECAHLGATGCGIDANPLAVFLANAKLQALATPASELRVALTRLSAKVHQTRNWHRTIGDDPRAQYLKAWFTPAILRTLEIIDEQIRDIAAHLAPFFLAIASNLLRDYSLQDPHDLRIRRRTSPLPELPFTTALLSACEQSVARVEAAQPILGVVPPLGGAMLSNVIEVKSIKNVDRFDAAITSPPYATALPYIDTQRLSLVWLNLLRPDQILELEAALIGSREIRGLKRSHLVDRMKNNAGDLPKAEAAFCSKLQRALGRSDGFRRQAVPALLYRYLEKMLHSLDSIRAVMKPRSRFALVIGHNHTVLGGTRYDIDTPRHLANLAQHAGWDVEELFELQSYHRYGYHMNNAVRAETLLLLRNR